VLTAPAAPGMAPAAAIAAAVAAAVAPGLATASAREDGVPTALGTCRAAQERTVLWMG
jgi:hypothetical protein